MQIEPTVDKSEWQLQIMADVAGMDPIPVADRSQQKFRPTTAQIIYTGGSLYPVIVMLRGPQLHADGTKSRKPRTRPWPDTHIKPRELQDFIDKHRPEWL